MQSYLDTISHLPPVPEPHLLHAVNLCILGELFEYRGWGLHKVEIGHESVVSCNDALPFPCSPVEFDNHTVFLSRIRSAQEPDVPLHILNIASENIIVAIRTPEPCQQPSLLCTLRLCLSTLTWRNAGICCAYGNR